MAQQLKISTGQCSNKGRKKINQDYHSFSIPEEPLLSSKGIAIAMADGISSSDVSQIASEASVKSFLEDYYCTSESWSVKTSVQKVLSATNSWLYAQTRQSRYRFEKKDRGYVCTFSAMIIKSTTAHLFHIGDTRIYQMVDNHLEQLTDDHRHWMSQHESYLSRALGVTEQLDFDYKQLNIETGDIFILATDGIYEFVNEGFITETIKNQANDLDKAAQNILDEAYEQGSDDNLTIQIVRIDELPELTHDEIYQQLTSLPFPPTLEARVKFDGYEIIRELYISSRSYVYLAKDTENQQQVVIKVPAMEHRDNVAYLERFFMEEWIARRINNAHVLKADLLSRKRHYLYTVTEYLEGQTLAQWMIDNPTPDLETVRCIVEQIATGLRAFHRQEMLHQDLRPNNIMIDASGTVKIIDFGSTYVAGIMEIDSPVERQEILGTAQYTAPEYFLGERGTTRSDLFSLGVITYQMLSGRLPYGTMVSQARSRAAQHKLCYESVLDDEREIPAWIDDAIKKSVQPDPYKRYQSLSEFLYDLRHPNKTFLNKTRPPLMDQNPLLFWKSLSFILFTITLVLLFTHPIVK